MKFQDDIGTTFSDDFLDLQDLYGEFDEDDTKGYLSSSLTMEENEWGPCFSLQSSKNSETCLLVDEINQLDKESSLLHLLKAYGEAVEKGESELAMVIVESINEKSSLMGSTLERFSYSLFRSREDCGEYLRKESSENFVVAFNLFYQALPLGRFAHFVANSEILESVSDYVTTIHVVDFELGQGVQWPPMIEALSQKHKKLRLTSIKSEDRCFPSWDFGKTKKWLLDHSRKYGLEPQIEEKSIEDLASELMRMKKRGRGEEWLAFNCMVGLPHMGRRPRNLAKKFLKMGKNLLANFAGIVIIGDGEVEDMNTCSSFSSFFDKFVRHHNALYEALDSSFSVDFAEARTAIESLFLGPKIDLFSWYELWEDIAKGCDLGVGTELKVLKLSRVSLVEAKQMVNEVESSYKVEIGWMRENEMILKWKDVPLARVSKWM
ncbi:protein NODULATION SIGNALING PATHWAY 2-like [Primulina huaijiensis]|uniref:protein NODULATION SIGNALING PATHWAY 2-like n=1 Tax=Primulina huaijiensis TaxID=1492673 RepID=UPI003CC6F29A